MTDRTKQIQNVLFFAPQPALILLYWITGWIWPMYIIAGAAWISFGVIVMATGITKLVNEPLGTVTIHASKVRKVPTPTEFAMSIVIMVLTFHAFLSVGFHLTLLAYLVVCIVNLVTRALSWYSKLDK